MEWLTEVQFATLYGWEIVWFLVGCLMTAVILFFMEHRHNKIKRRLREHERELSRPLNLEFKGYSVFDSIERVQREREKSERKDN